MVLSPSGRSAIGCGLPVIFRASRVICQSRGTPPRLLRNSRLPQSGVQTGAQSSESLLVHGVVTAPDRTSISTICRRVGSVGESADAAMVVPSGERDV